MKSISLPVFCYVRDDRTSVLNTAQSGVPWSGLESCVKERLVTAQILPAVESQWRGLGMYERDSGG